MALMQTPLVDRSFICPDFSLKGIDGKVYSRDAVKGEKGLLVVFMCNHCPYVKGITDRLETELEAVRDMGIGVIAINANDTEKYPADSFENMQVFAHEHGFTFPYVIDESQQVARAFDAVCTPDFFGFNADGELRYRGRLDSAGKDPVDATTVRELVEAMDEMARTGDISRMQVPSMGCSIKWKI